MPFLTAHNIRAGYNSLEVLHGVDFMVDAGELVAVLGPNGAGKSTLLGALARTVKIFSGELRVGDTSAVQLRPSDVLHSGVALVPQEANVFGDLSVHENLLLASAAVTGSGGRTARGGHDHARVYERFPFLERRKDQPATLLSGGERQALAVSMGFLQHPKVMLLDEPTAGLSPIAAQNLGEWIIELVASGIAVVWVVEQDPDMVLAEASRAYLLDGGSFKFDGDAKDLLGRGASLLFDAPARKTTDRDPLLQSGETFTTERTRQ